MGGLLTMCTLQTGKQVSMDDTFKRTLLYLFSSFCGCFFVYPEITKDLQDL